MILGLDFNLEGMCQVLWLGKFSLELRVLEAQIVYKLLAAEVNVDLFSINIFLHELYHLDNLDCLLHVYDIWEQKLLKEKMNES